MPVTSTAPRIRFNLAGQRGPRILLIMGYGMPGIVWRPQIEGLRRHCRLIFFDNRGIGASDPVRGSLSIGDMARDAVRVLDEAEWNGQVHLVGVSMGGMIVQELALLQPWRFASLSLLATHAGGPLAALPTVAGLRHFFAASFGSERSRQDAVMRLLYPDSYLRGPAGEAIVNRTRLLQQNPSPNTIRRQLQAIARHDTRRRLERLPMPTLIIKPEKDILVRPTWSDDLRRRIPRSILVSLPDAGHGLTFQSAAQINRRLLRHFLGDEGGSGTTGTPRG